ncbi:MAG TPA: patatin-like phospholipase family protein [Acidimicrobiales bacterium]|nr:patatin-like phospholipase family protein [Acidimicrobiales bacterium]
MGRLRIGLSISGAVALGAYEGGALAALLVAVQRLLKEPDPLVQVDAIAGSSAGSITGVLTARALLEGYDPVEVMRKSWVEADSLANLVRGADRHAPLSTETVQGMANELLDLTTKKTKQDVPVGVVMSIAALQGLLLPDPEPAPGCRPAPRGGEHLPRLEPLHIPPGRRPGDVHRARRLVLGHRRGAGVGRQRPRLPSQAAQPAAAGSPPGRRARGADEDRQHP